MTDPTDHRLQPGRLTRLARCCGKFIVGILLFIALTATSEAATAATPERGPLDEAFVELATLQQGQGLEILRPIRLALLLYTLLR